MIFYLHIPKTGGQTLATRIANAFSPERVRIIMDEFSRGDVVRLRKMVGKYDFVEGHLNGAVLADFSEPDVMATVRRPPEHLLSMYRHIQREPANLLHRPAVKLPFREFFDSYAEELTNFQSTYLVGSFIPADPGQLVRPRRWLLDRLYPGIERVRWLVPTEQIDEFSTLWSIEARREMPYASANINVAGRKSGDTDILDFIEGRPDLYDVDLCLWNEARDNFARYRREMLAPGRNSDSGACPFAGDTGAIWLRDGWHPAGVRSDGIREWWSGPQRRSRIRIRRSNRDTMLTFEIACFMGVRPDQMLALSTDGHRLDLRIKQIDQNLHRAYIPLDNLPDQSEIDIVVPQTMSALQLSEAGRDPRRQAFATQNWSLTSKDVIDDNANTAGHRAVEPAG
jgi:hypothetical protein